jgi:hypothetical protein
MNAERSAAPALPEALPDWHVRCGLCQMVVPTESATLIVERGVLCEYCLDAVRTATASMAMGNQE